MAITNVFKANIPPHPDGAISHTSFTLNLMRVDTNKKIHIMYVIVPHNCLSQVELNLCMTSECRINFYGDRPPSQIRNEVILRRLFFCCFEDDDEDEWIQQYQSHIRPLSLFETYFQEEPQDDLPPVTKLVMPMYTFILYDNEDE